MARRAKLPEGVRAGPPARDGSARWYIRWRAGPKEHKILIVAASARDAAEKREECIAAGTPQPSRGPTTTPISTAVVAFLENRTTHATKIQDTSNLKRLTEVMADRPIGAITTPDLRVWMDGLKQLDGSPYSPASLMAIRRSCRALWSWAIERGMAEHNPARDLRVESGRRARGRGPAPKAAKRHLELDELRSLFAWLAENAPHSHDLLFRTQFRLGLRIGEVCCLRRDLIDWKQGLVTVDRAISQGELSPTKPGKQTTHYLSKPGRKELRAWMEATPDPKNTGYVFIKKAKLGDKWPFFQPRYVGRTFKQALEAHDGFDLDPRTTTHALRHSWYEIARSFAGVLSHEDIASVLSNRAETAASYYASGPGLMARRIADHLEEVVFGISGSST